MIGEGIAAAHTIIVGAILTAGAIGAAAAFVLCVAAFCVGPLIAPSARTVRKGLSARLRAEVPPDAPRALRPSDRRPTPRWALPPDGESDGRKPQKAA